MAQLPDVHLADDNIELCSFCKPRLYNLSDLGWDKEYDSPASSLLLTPHWHLDDTGKPRLKSRKVVDTFSANAHLPPGYDGLRGVEIDGDESCIKIEYYREDILPHCPSITTSTQNGCTFCALLISLVNEDLTDFAYSQGCRPLFSVIEFHIIPRVDDLLSPCDRAQFVLESLVIRKAQPANVRDHFFLLIAAPKDSVTASTLNIVRRPNSANVADSNNIALIRSWLAACDGKQDHRICRSLQAPTLPTRVVDVSGINTTGQAKLVLSNTSAAEYVALSYCWPRQTANDAKPIVTNSSNVETMLSSIDVSKLTGSQQICLKLAENLGIQYVWIDGLCIIQDSDSDWRSESSKMGEIYENATLTIIPSANLSDPSQRQLDTWHSIPWCFGNETSLLGTYLLGVADGDAFDMWCGGKYGIEEPPVTWPGSDNYTWRSRGWTFQEETLASRKLYLGDTRMQFLCRSARGIEDTLWLRRARPLSPFHGRATSFLTDAQGQALSCAREIYDHWYQKLEVYGDRLLTYSSDTLIAVGGLAERLSAILQSQSSEHDSHDYIGGIWKSDLARGLLWASAEVLVSGINHLPCRRILPPDLEGASWLWSSHQLPSSREHSHVADKKFRYFFFCEGQQDQACNLNFESQCRLASYALDPPPAPIFTPSRVVGEIEITGRMFEMECIWEFRVSPLEGMQPLALPAPLEDIQGFDDPQFDIEGSGGISVRFEWPGGGRNNWRCDCHWTQKIHDTVSRGKFRCFAMLMVYGVFKNPFSRFRHKDIFNYMHSTAGLLLVPDDPKEKNPKRFRWFGTFFMPGESVAVNQHGVVVGEVTSEPRADTVFDSVQTHTIIVY